jgi:DNA repair exonuclease SbcCD ATPase subunit
MAQEELRQFEAVLV